MAEKRPFKKEILKVGEWNYKGAPGGKLKFTRDSLQKLADNFHKHNPFSPVIRGHQTNKALEENPELIIASNIRDLHMEGDSLYAMWDMDPEEAEKYADVSVSIQPDYEDHRTGEQVGDIITHIAMVVSPYLKTLSSFVPLGENAHEHYFIHLSEITMADAPKVEETVEKPEVEEEAPKAESEAETPVTETETPKEEVAEPKVEEEVTPEVAAPVAESSEDVKAELAEVQKQLAEAKKKLREGEAEKLYSKFLSEGKVTPAAKLQFIALAEFGAEQTINLADGSKPFSEVFCAFLDKLPKAINLKEAGVVTEDKPTKISVEFREQLLADKRKVNPQFSEEDLDKYVNDNIEVVQKYEKKFRKQVNS